VCVAVGYYNNPKKGKATLAERWNGKKWSIQPTPNPTGNFGHGSELDALSCSSRTACTAVGTSVGGKALAERWNGSRWSIQRTPTAVGAALAGVSCTSAMACTAVGSYSYVGGLGLALTLAEHWNGAKWSIESTPDPGAKTNGLSAVSCTSVKACTAVGEYVGKAGQATLAEHWTGNRWSIQTTSNPQAGYPSRVLESSLGGVSCISSSPACAAVGNSIAPPGYTQTLAEQWNGRVWSIQDTISPIGEDSSLNGVWCMAATACTAVGNTSVNGTISVPLAEAWNGKRWANETTSEPAGGLDSSLGDVSCTSATACTAVGSYRLRSQSVVTVPLAERWNGKIWTIQTTPNLA